MEMTLAKREKQAKLKHLQYIDVTGTGIMIEAAVQLHASNPRCHITDNWCCGCMTFWPIEDAD